MRKINFREKGLELQKAFFPVHLAEINGTALRIARIHGEYRWHVHPNEDEFFIVVEGEVTVETKLQTFTLKEWEGLLVPKGLPHRTKAETPSVVLIIEPVQTNTYGVFVEEE